MDVHYSGSSFCLYISSQSLPQLADPGLLFHLKTESAPVGSYRCCAASVIELDEILFHCAIFPFILSLVQSVLC